jgi:hypothetical protein
MVSSLPAIDDPAHEREQYVTLPPARGSFDTHDAPLDEARWDVWVAKGRRADQALIEKVRMLTLLGVTVGVAAGTVWIFLG